MALYRTYLKDIQKNIKAVAGYLKKLPALRRGTKPTLNSVGDRFDLVLASLACFCSAVDDLYLGHAVEATGTDSKMPRDILSIMRSELRSAKAGVRRLALLEPTFRFLEDVKPGSVPPPKKVKGMSDRVDQIVKTSYNVVNAFDRLCSGHEQVTNQNRRTFTARLRRLRTRHLPNIRKAIKKTLKAITHLPRQTGLVPDLETVSARVEGIVGAQKTFYVAVNTMHYLHDREAELLTSTRAK